MVAHRYDDHSNYCGTCMMASPLYDYRMLSLTYREQIVLVLILAALLIGAGIRHFRMMRELPIESSIITNPR